MYAVCVVYALCSRDFVARNPQGSSARWIGFINQTLERCICVWVILVENTIAVGFRVCQCILEFGMRFTSIRIYIQLAIYLTFFRISAGIAQSVLLKFFPRLLKLSRFFVTYKKMYYEMHTVTLLRRYFARVSTIFSNLKFCISGFYIVQLECKICGMHFS